MHMHVSVNEMRGMVNFDLRKKNLLSDIKDLYIERNIHQIGFQSFFTPPRARKCVSKAELNQTSACGKHFFIFQNFIISPWSFSIMLLY